MAKSVQAKQEKNRSTLEKNLQDIKNVKKQWDLINLNQPPHGLFALQLLNQPINRKNKMNKNQIISVKILAAIESGMDIQAAFDSVLGEGAYIKMAGDLYDALRAKNNLK